MIHLEILVEERSAEPIVRRVAESLLPAEAVEVRVFEGKPDLLGSLPQRLRGYRKWHNDGLRIMVLIDRDNGDCLELKQQLEAYASAAGMTTRSTSGADFFQVCNRIAVEELEAWILGDEAAMCAAFPKVRPYASKAKFRDPDAIVGAWEATERLLQSSGYYRGGLRKVDLATRIAPHLDLERNRSSSFRAFVTGAAQLVSS